MPRSLIDGVQITADNTDVLSGRIKPPTWARWVDFWLKAIDSDWTYSVSVDGVEYARSAPPNECAADNVLSGRAFEGGYATAPIEGSNADILINVDVVTGSEGVMIVRYRPA